MLRTPMTRRMLIAALLAFLGLGRASAQPYGYGPPRYRGPPPGYYRRPPPGYYRRAPPGYYGRPPPGYYRRRGAQQRYFARRRGYRRY